MCIVLRCVVFFSDTLRKKRRYCLEKLKLLTKVGWTCSVLKNLPILNVVLPQSAKLPSSNKRRIPQRLPARQKSEKKKRTYRSAQIGERRRGREGLSRLRRYFLVCVCVCFFFFKRKIPLVLFFFFL